MENTNNSLSTCLICGYQTSTESDLESHLKFVHSSVANSCPFCPFSSESVEDLQTHVTTLHSDELKTPTKKDTSEIATTSDVEALESCCPICDKKYETTFLTQHIELHFIGQEDEIKSFPEKDLQPGCSTQPSLSTSNDNVNTDADAIIAKQFDLAEMKKIQEEKFSKHKAEEIEFKKLQEKYNFNPNDKVSFKQQAFKNMEKSMGRKKLSTAEYYDKKFTMLEKLSEGIDDGLTLTTNILPQLSASLLNFNDKNTMWLTCNNVDHYSSGYGDSGWGCGFRNIQMLLSSLMNITKYKELLNSKLNGSIPSIPKLQDLIEQAWGVGFDPRGKDQLEGKLTNTRKWIGATEVFSLLSSFGFHCEIVDFHKYSNPTNRTHPLFFKWIFEYFYNSSNPTDTNNQTRFYNLNLPCLYLQHDGHSRSIVGVQVNLTNNQVTHLLVFDPGISKSKIQSSIKGTKNSTSLPKLFLKKINNFKHLQYQIVAVVGIASEEQFEKQKCVDNLSTRIP